MHRRLLALATATIILLMVLPPVLNAFDSWDHKPELPLVGHDTETTLAILALEAATGMAVAWSSVVLLSWFATVLLSGLLELKAGDLHRGVRATDYLLLLFSPPWHPLSLRI